ncbi:cytochrome C [Nitrosococcus wardiae]|uniref:Cytochrome C n=2 Tax=Nitrosococcus wardiae TaxID=1814290 RepID=A0A4V1AW45_9GAMM|nr:cytochrome C [Nitrosococcus wardiae]
MRQLRRTADLLLASVRSLNWRRQLRTIIVFLAVLAVGGFLIAASGIIPIKASSGHWALTRWFLSFSMSRSVATHSMGIKVPKLADPSLVLQGAGHYETGCRFCHGRPGLRHPPVPRQMTPHPPYLPPVLPKRESGELFYIVKHGVKFTGMPAWPALQRDDEVWAMVAFLRVLPKLNAAQYEELIRGDDPVRDGKQAEEVPPVVVESCGRCHGVDGLGRGVGAFPRLAGQHIPYLYASLSAYARGERHSGMMEPIAAELSSEERRTLARYYGNLPPSIPLPPQKGLAEAIERGEIIAKQGIPSQRIPSCVDCHGPSTIPRNPYYPVLAGQYFEYLVSQLKLFAKEYRGGTPYVRLMHPTAHQLTEEQIRDVARYYASLP